MKQACRSSLLLGQNVRWPRCMLPPDESRWVCRRDRQTDGRTRDRYITLSARRGRHKKCRVHVFKVFFLSLSNSESCPCNSGCMGVTWRVSDSQLKPISLSGCAAGILVPPTWRCPSYDTQLVNVKWPGLAPLTRRRPGRLLSNSCR